MTMEVGVNPIPLEELIATGAEEKSGVRTATTIIGSSLAIVSLISSSALIWMIKSSRVRFTTVYHRILLGMSIADIIFSLSLAHFNFTAPSDDDYFVWNASGNQASCSFQGFLTTVGAISGIFYSCSLNLYSLAVVKYEKTENYVSRYIEPFLHGVPIALSLITGTALLVKKNFNDQGGGNCYAPVYRPQHCIGYEDGQTREGFEIPCGRGSDGAIVFYYLSGYMTVFIGPLIIGTSLGVIYRSVLKSETRMARYGANNFPNGTQQPSGDGNANERVNRISLMNHFTRYLGQTTRSSDLSGLDRSDRSSDRNQSNSRAVLQRALAYSISYTLTWLFFIIGTFCDIAGIGWPTSISYLANIFNPLQGFFNFFIFMYPKVKKAKARGDESMTWFQAFGNVFWSGSRGSGGAIGGRGNQAPNRLQQGRVAREVHWRSNVLVQSDTANLSHGTRGGESKEAATDADVEDGSYKEFAAVLGTPSQIPDYSQDGEGLCRRVSLEDRGAINRTQQACVTREEDGRPNTNNDATHRLGQSDMAKFSHGTTGGESKEAATDADVEDGSYKEFVAVLRVPSRIDGEEEKPDDDDIRASAKELLRRASAAQKRSINDGGLEPSIRALHEVHRSTLNSLLDSAEEEEECPIRGSAMRLLRRVSMAKSRTAGSDLDSSIQVLVEVHASMKNGDEKESTPAGENGFSCVTAPTP